MSLNQTDADLHHALDMWLLNVIGRSDDGRLVFQPDFLPPRQIKAIGDAPTCLVQALDIFCLAHALHLKIHSTTK
jgi:hypothetical protein